MKIICRTTQDRGFDIDKSYDIYAKGGELIYCVDTEKKPRDNLKKSLLMSNNEPHLNVEDDCIVSERFWDICSDRIARYPNDFITFFTLCNISGDTWVRGKQWLNAQCLYIPAGHAFEIIKYEPIFQQSDRFKKLVAGGNDSYISEYLASRKLKVLSVYPNVVQHRVVKSRIDPRRSSKRQSKCFIDNLALI